MKRTAVLFCVLFAMALGFRTLSAQQPTPPPAAGIAKPSAEADDGIPITNATVKTVCGDCHAEDDKGRMSRISYRRTTPEGWQETIRRMATLNKSEI